MVLDLRSIRLALLKLGKQMTIKNVLRIFVNILYKLSTAGLSKGPHVTRYFMYKHLSKKYAEPRSENLRVLSVSRSQHLARLLGFDDRQITDVSYPEFNIFSLPFGDDYFDAVVSDQVMEHLEGNPQFAIDEVFRILKPNGIFLHTTCFINPVHGCPNDYWRFTPDALKLLTEKHGRIWEVGGWGNPYVWLFIAMGLRSRPIPNSRWHPAHWLAIKNNQAWPIVTWVIGQKGNRITIHFT
ncbi:MAG: methyltransferase domain-containing protein [Nitrospira sp.]|nr:methyltransferase domain-containing protein [Nitrospira sp.]